jgi:hypothetical protein
LSVHVIAELSEVVALSIPTGPLGVFPTNVELEIARPLRLAPGVPPYRASTAVARISRLSARSHFSIATGRRLRRAT